MSQQTPCGSDGGSVPEAASPGARGSPAAPTVKVHELELKLQGTPADLADLVDLPAVQRVRHGPVGRLRQVTTYSDTPELELAARGLALRTREQDGVRRHGVKSLGSAGGLAGIAGRDEWEWPAAPGAAGLAPPAELAALLPEDVQRRLVPLFRTDIRRTVLTVAPNLLTLIEIAVDIGHISTFSATDAQAGGQGGGQTMAQVAEVELELKAGRAAELLAFALELQEALPLRLTVRSKADTALALRGVRLPPPAAAPPVFTPATTVAEAFRSTVRLALADLLRADDALRLDGGAEAVALLREALAALDAAATLFGPAVADPMLRDLRRTARAMLRRLDRLQGAALLAAAAPAPRLAAGIDARRRRLAARLDQELRSAAWRRFPLHAAAWLEGGAWRESSPGLDQPLPATAAALLQRRLQALRLSGLADAGRRGRRRAARRLAHAAAALALLRGSAASPALSLSTAAAMAAAAAEAAAADAARREARRIARSAAPEDRAALGRLAGDLADRRRRAIARLASLPRR